MKTHRTEKFNYTKADGSVSDREVFILSVPSNMYFGIDISEFSEEEKEVYTEVLENMYEEYFMALREEVNNMGLGTNFRNFRSDRVNKKV